MGNTAVKFEADAEALDGTGLKVCVSNVIEGMTPEKFLEGLQEVILTTPPPEMIFAGVDCKRNYKAWKEDGAIITALTVGTPQNLPEMLLKLLPDLETTHYSRYVIDPENDLVQCSFHNYDKTLRKDTCSRVGTWKIHRDPFRLEYWLDRREARLAGTGLKNMTVAQFKAAGLETTAEAEQPSIGDPSKLSILSSPVSGDWNVEKLFTMTAEVAKKSTDGAVTELPDGGLLYEARDFSDLSTVYQCQSLSDDKQCMITRKFNDPGLLELRGTDYCRQFSDPVRFEIWHESCGRRDATAQEAEHANNLSKQIVQYWEKRSAYSSGGGEG